MNERIRELADEARIKFSAHWAHQGVDTAVITRLDLKEFAELIVLEMCKELDKAQWDKGEDWICADGTRIIPQIKEHFGVEE